MNILLDTANLEKIEYTMKYFPISGFTTNPSILAHESDDVVQTLTTMRHLADGHLMIHAQVTAADTAGIVDQAKRLKLLWGKISSPKYP